MSDEPFVLDHESNPHPRLLTLALEARRRARLSDTNHAAKAYYLGVFHACVEATGCDEGEITAWLDRHDDRPIPATVPMNTLPDEAIDAAVRSRRLAHQTPEPIVWRHWDGMLELLTHLLGASSADVDAWVAAHDDFDASTLSHKEATVPPAITHRVEIKRRR